MTKSKILVVEDDRSLADVLVYNLREAGYEVTLSRDGQDGLTQAQLKTPDLMILDLMLPVIDGLDVCRRVRADPALVNMLVLIVRSIRKKLGGNASLIETVRGVGYRFSDLRTRAENAPLEPSTH